MVDVALKADFLDCAAWRRWLEREEIPCADAYVGVLGRGDFAAGTGRLLVWRVAADGVRVSLRAYRRNGIGADVALLLVTDAGAVDELLAEGLPRMRELVRSGAIHPYMLMTLDDLHNVGLADFVEELGLVFPRH